MNGEPAGEDVVTVRAEESGTILVPLGARLQIRSFHIPVVRPDQKPRVDVQYDREALELVAERAAEATGEGSQAKLLEFRPLRQGSSVVTIRLVAPDGAVQRSNTIEIEVRGE